MTLSENDTNSTGAWQGVIRRYAKYLPVDDSTPVVSLLEGNTPLIRADRLAREIGGDIELHLKYEGLNPTASFKDRGMTVAVSKAMERGAEVVVCASTGNTPRRRPTRPAPGSSASCCCRTARSRWANWRRR